MKEVLDLIYEKIADGTDYKTHNKEKFVDSYGNPKRYIKESRYSFQEIHKRDMGIITGKLVRTFNKPSEKLDAFSNRMMTTYVEESVSIYFYYDVYKEMITFCERHSFGYNQFMNAFSSMLNKSVGIYEFEIFLQKDKDVLEEKLKHIKVVQKVRATLIPPNSNEDDLQELRESLLYMQQFQDANANKASFEYVSEDMKMESQVMKDIFKAVSRGYGDVTATGINASGRIQTISSSHDAAYTANIQENISEEDYNDESKNLILRFLIKVTKKVLA